jgi:hypothetical protein
MPAEDNTSPTSMILKELVKNQALMSTEIKELARAISKMDLLMEKLVNIESKHTESNSAVLVKIKELGDTLNAEVKEFESCKMSGCPALHKAELKIEYELKNIKDDVSEIMGMKNKIMWGISAAVGMSLLNLVLKGS